MTIRRKNKQAGKGRGRKSSASAKRGPRKARARGRRGKQCLMEQAHMARKEVDLRRARMEGLLKDVRLNVRKGNKWLNLKTFIHQVSGGHGSPPLNLTVDEQTM